MFELKDRTDYLILKLRFVTPKMFSDMPCMKEFYRDPRKEKRSTGQQLGTKSGLCSADKPKVNCPLCFAVGLDGISLVRASGKALQAYGYDSLEGAKDSCLLGDWGTILSASRPARLRSAPRRPDSLVVQYDSPCCQRIPQTHQQFQLSRTYSCTTYPGPLGDRALKRHE